MSRNIVKMLPFTSAIVILAAIGWQGCGEQDTKKNHKLSANSGDSQAQEPGILATGPSGARLPLVAISTMDYFTYLPIAGKVTSPTGRDMHTEITLTSMKADTQGNIQFIAEDGSTESVSFTLTHVGDTVSISPPKEEVYSAYIAATGPVAGIAETLTLKSLREKKPDTAYTAAASEFKTDLVATNVKTRFIPLLMRKANSLSGTVNSLLVIQNASIAKNKIKLSFPNLDKVIEFELAPKASYKLDLVHEASFPDNWSGSALLEGTENVAATVFQFNGEPDSVVQSYDAISESVEKYHVAFFASQLQNGLNTLISVMNSSGTEFAAGEVSIHCQSTQSDGKNFTLSNPKAIPANHSYHFNPADPNTNSGFPKDWYGSCTVQNEAKRGMSAFVQMRFIMDGQKHAAAYNAIPHTAVDNASPYYLSIVPRVIKNISWNAGAYASSVTIKNLGDGEANLIYKYFGGAGHDDVTFEGKIPAGGNVNHNHRVADHLANSVSQLPDGFQGSLFIWSDQPIGVMNQLQYKSVGADSYMAVLAPVYKTDSLGGGLVFGSKNTDENDPFAGIQGLSIGDCKLSPTEIEAVKIIFQHSEQKRTEWTCNATLQAEARRKAVDLATRGYFAHTDPDGYGPNYFVRKAGYPLPGYYGKGDDANNIESLGGGYQSAQRVADGWFNSPAHKVHVYGIDDFWRKQNEFGLAHHVQEGSAYVNYWVLHTAYPEE